MSNALPTSRQSGAHRRNVSSVLVSCAVSHKPVLSPIRQLPNASTAPTTTPIAIGSHGSGRSVTLRSYRRPHRGDENPVAALRQARSTTIPIKTRQVDAGLEGVLGG